MSKFAISWMNFFDNTIIMDIIEADNEQKALEVAFSKLVEVEYAGGGFDADIKQAAFNCDGMIGAKEIV